EAGAGRGRVLVDAEQPGDGPVLVDLAPAGPEVGEQGDLTGQPEVDADAELAVEERCPAGAGRRRRLDGATAQTSDQVERDLIARRHVEDQGTARGPIHP